MAQVLSSINIKWASRGKLSYSISGGHSSQKKNILYILAPSLPMIVSHQLGVLKPSHGLILCSRLIDYYKDKKHILVPINTALTKARIDFLRTRRGTTINFHPKTRFLANSDSVEEGVRQLINNYISLVSDIVPSPTYQVMVAFIGSAMGAYFDFLQNEINASRVSPRRDKWNPNFSATMASFSRHIAETYGPELGPDADIEEIKEIQMQKLSELSKKHNSLARSLGMMS